MHKGPARPAHELGVLGEKDVGVGDVLGDEEAEDADPEQVHTETLLGGAQVGEQDWDLLTHSLASLF